MFDPINLLWGSVARNIARALLFMAALTLGISVGPRPAQAQGMILSIGITAPNPAPTRPTAPVNTLQDLMTALQGCWSPPNDDQKSGTVDVTFQVSFKRSGELFGKPRVITFSQPVTAEQRGRYYTAVAEALILCSEMPFTASMGGAVAGRVFRINLIDLRHRKTATWSQKGRRPPDVFPRP